MSRAGRGLSALEKRPWLLATLAAAGVTLLLPSALALYGPPELLDRAMALGDVRLTLGLLALFAASAVLGRILLRRRRLPEEALDEYTSPERPAGEPPLPKGPPRDEHAAKTYLR
jgi:hypothetical protein